MPATEGNPKAEKILVINNQEFIALLMQYKGIAN